MIHVQKQKQVKTGESRTCGFISFSILLKMQSSPWLKKKKYVKFFQSLEMAIIVQLPKHGRIVVQYITLLPHSSWVPNLMLSLG